MTEVVALFATRNEAENAIDMLDGMGYDASKVGYINRQSDVVADTTMGRDSTTGDYASTRGTDGDNLDGDKGDMAEEGAKGVAGGAVGGAAVGAGAGLLASAGLALIPGVGPFLAAGTLLGTLGATAAGAAGGAVLGGVAGTIFGAANDDTSSTYYREGVEQGGSLVTVSVDDNATSEVTTLLNNAGAKKVDVHGETGWMV